MLIGDRIEKLGKQAEFWYTKLSDNVFRQSSLQFIMLGWVISAEGAIKGLDAIERLIFCGVLVVYSAAITGVYLELGNKSKFVFERLQILDSDVAEDNARFRVTSKFWGGMTLLHWLITAVSIWLIFTAKN